jgi:hypothetical protein
MADDGGLFDPIQASRNSMRAAAGQDLSWWDKLNMNMAQLFGTAVPADQALPSEVLGIPVGGRERMKGLSDALVLGGKVKSPADAQRLNQQLFAIGGGNVPESAQFRTFAMGEPKPSPSGKSVGLNEALGPLDSTRSASANVAPATTPTVNPMSTATAAAGTGFQPTDISPRVMPSLEPNMSAAERLRIIESGDGGW